jgi:predicted PurR-regulated permease PerM
MVAALTFLYLVRSILLPFVLALLLSVLLDPAVRKLRLFGMSRSGAVATVMLTFVLIAAGAIAAIGPQIVRQVGSLATSMSQQVSAFTAESEHSNFFVAWNPKYQIQTPGPTEGVDIWLKGHSKLLQSLDLPASVDQFVNQDVQPHKEEIAAAAKNYFGSFLGFLTGFGSKLVLILFTPVFTWFILSDLDKFKQGTTRMIPPSIRKDVLGLFQDIGEVFGRYLRGIATVLIYYSVLAAIVLSLLGAPYAILLALLFAIIYLIPMLGPIINIAILVFVTVISGKSSTFFPVVHMSSPLSFAITIAVVYFIIMTMFDQLVYARIVGQSVGLHPVVSFFVIFSGATLFGAIGMILAFPVAGSIKVILDRMLRFTSKDATEDGLRLPTIPLRHQSTVKG